jgi:hypothetical protein
MRWLPALSLFSAVPAAAQAVRGGLLGVVTDTSGAVVANASVAILEMQTGGARSVATNESGSYSAPNLPPGMYRVTVEALGFRKVIREDVDVAVNTTVRVDVELQPGAVSESINVTSEIPALQTDRADTGRKIDSRQIVSMPLLFNRNFQGLLTLAPGVNRPFRPHSELANPQDALSVRVNGQARQANNVQIEGVDNNTRTNRLTVLIPPIEALESIDISTSNYEAELGRAGGAVTNVTLRSGTNQLHGSVFEFNRVSRLAARNVFAATKAPVTYNQFGFTLGGPIRRNRTFFFGDYQGVRDRRGDLTIATIPTARMRVGDLSEAPTAIYDPETGAADGRGREPFAAKLIPASRISPIARRILALIPPPHSAALNANFQRSLVRPKDTNSFDVKGDHNFTAHTRVSARYSYQRAVTDPLPLYGAAGGGPSSGSGPAGTAGHGLFRAQSGAINLTHVFSPALIADARVGVSRYRNDSQQSDFGTRASADLGIPGVNISDYTSGLTQINIDGFSNPVVGFTNSLPWIRAETGLFYVGSLTKISGKHTFKFGTEVRRQGDVADLPDTYGARGSFTFSAGPASLNGDPRVGFGNALAAFLLDHPARSARELRSVIPELRSTAIFSYVQDKWQATSRITIDLGLRHETFLPPRPRFPGGFSNYDPNTNTLRIGGIGSVPMNTGNQVYWTGFTPRLGISWRLNDKTVLRGGYGASLITPGLEVKGYYNYPVRQFYVATSPNTYLPAGALARGFPPPAPVVIPSDGIIRNPSDDSFRFVAPGFKEGMLKSWNVALQRSLRAGFVLEAAYVGNHGSRYGVPRDINAGEVPGAGQRGQPLFQKFGIRTSVTNDYFPTSTDYHSLQMKLDRKFSGGFQMTTSYTFSKAIDYSNDNGGLFIHSLPQLNRARSSENPAHVFVQSYIYDLPFGKGRRWAQSGAPMWLLGGWQVNGILTMQTGFPLNITASSATLNAPGNGNRPNIGGRPQIIGNAGPGQLWMDIAPFSAPAPATYGNLGRNVLEGPGLVNLDFSIFRRFRMTERWSAELRFESFNFSNTPHFNPPNGGFGSAGFGSITTALQDQRTNQFGLKVLF